ncbi:unnamed protein product [Symbiodinium sp. CCMP2592]|nr:unnamed protein product [Symbiodinium sp. CCMP2592]
MVNRPALRKSSICCPSKAFGSADVAAAADVRTWSDPPRWLREEASAFIRSHMDFIKDDSKFFQAVRNDDAPSHRAIFLDYETISSRPARDATSQCLGRGGQALRPLCSRMHLTIRGHGRLLSIRSLEEVLQRLSEIRDLYQAAQPFQNRYRYTFHMEVLTEASIRTSPLRPPKAPIQPKASLQVRADDVFWAAGDMLLTNGSGAAAEREKLLHSNVKLEGATKLCRIVAGRISPNIKRAQVKHADSLVFYRMRGFPPWPGLVLPCKHRSYLQGPMNPLCPPEDAIFDRVQNCIQRGKARFRSDLKVPGRVDAGIVDDVHTFCQGMKRGDTIIARVREDADAGSDSDLSFRGLVPLPEARAKAKILRVFQKHLEVRYKRSGVTAKIPKSWGELLSRSVPQQQAAGKVKRASGKVRDVALRGSERGQVPSGFVIVYSYGDEMYRKVRAQSLIRYKPEEANRTFRGKSLRSCLQTITEASHRGFNGNLALREIQAEWERRQGIQQQQAELEQYRAHHNLPPSDLPKPHNDSDSSEEEDEAASDAEEEDPWGTEEEAASQDTSTEEE